MDRFLAQISVGTMPHDKVDARDRAARHRVAPARARRGSSRATAGTTPPREEDRRRAARRGARAARPRRARASAAAVREGALIVDIRSAAPARGRRRGARRAVYHPRNVLEWRADPASDACDPALAGDLERPVIVMCDAGYASSLAAVALQELGLRAGDRPRWRLPGMARGRPARRRCRGMSCTPRSGASSTRPSCRSVAEWDRADDAARRRRSTRLVELGLTGALVPARVRRPGPRRRRPRARVARRSRRAGSRSPARSTRPAWPPPCSLRHGTEEQRKRWLPRIARGEVLASFSITEPQAGSDLGRHRDGRAGGATAAGSCSTARSAGSPAASSS